MRTYARTPLYVQYVFLRRSHQQSLLRVQHGPRPRKATSLPGIFAYMAAITIIGLEIIRRTQPFKKILVGAEICTSGAGQAHLLVSKGMLMTCQYG